MKTIELRAYPIWLAPIVLIEAYIPLGFLSRILERHRASITNRVGRPPSIGEVIDLDYLEPMDMEDWELADMVGIPETDFLDLCLGMAPLTPEMAEKLGAALGTTADFWLSADRTYQEHHKKEMEQS